MDQPATSSPKGSSPTVLLPISSLRLPHISPPLVPSGSSPAISPSSPPLPIMNSISPPSVPVPSPSLPPAQRLSTKPLLVYQRRRLPHPSFPSSSSPHISQPSSLPSSLSSSPIIPILPPPPPSTTPTSQPLRVYHRLRPPCHPPIQSLPSFPSPYASPSLPSSHVSSHPTLSATSPKLPPSSMPPPSSPL